MHIKASELEFGPKIAEGKYGTVFKGKCRGQTVAIKLLHNQHLSEEKLEELKTEVEIMTYVFPSCFCYSLPVKVFVECRERGRAQRDSLCLLCTLEMKALYPLLFRRGSHPYRFQLYPSIYSRLRHPCILLLMGVCTEPNNVALVMEYVEGKGLDRILHDPKVPLSQTQQLRIAKDIAKGKLAP